MKLQLKTSLTKEQSAIVLADGLSFGRKYEVEYETDIIELLFYKFVGIDIFYRADYFEEVEV